MDLFVFVASCPQFFINFEHVTTAVTPSDSTLGEDVYAAEKILKSRSRQVKLQYLVKWTNYPVSQSTWEPEENLLDKRLLEEFHNNNK